MTDVLYNSLIPAPVKMSILRDERIKLTASAMVLYWASRSRDRSLANDEINATMWMSGLLARYGYFQKIQ